MTTLATDLYLLVAAYGLALPVSFAGLPVLGQGAFVAAGAVATFQLAAHGTPLLLAVAAAVALAGVGGYAVGFAATRLAGASLALATWALAWLAYTAMTVFPRLSGGSQGLLHPTPARLVSTTLGLTVTAYVWVHVLVAAVLAATLAVAVRRASTGPWGLDWAALRTGPVLADSLGVPVQRRRRALLAASGAIGALAGAGAALLAGVVAPGDYSPLLSLQLFVAVLLGGTATWWGPLLGVAVLAALPTVADHLATAAGIDPVRSRAVLTAVLLVLALALRDPIRRATARVTPGRRTRTPGRLEPAAAEPSLTSTASLAALHGVSVRYGAVPALDEVSLDLRAGEVHALVGPNGSGKSTALRALAGVVTPAAGRVSIAGSAAPPPGSAAARVHAGVVRTLQRTVMLGDLPAGLQVSIGARARERTAGLGWRHLFATPTARAIQRQRAATTAAALHLTGLDRDADTPAHRLDSAAQRRLQIARAAATGAPALLLDEPAAGMSATQRRELVALLRRLAAHGHGVLLVEHDMRLVGRAADRVTVLSAGQVLAHGSPAAIGHDPAVQRAYLGAVDPSSTEEQPA